MLKSELEKPGFFAPTLPLTPINDSLSPERRGQFPFASWFEERHGIVVPELPAGEPPRRLF